MNEGGFDLVTASGDASLRLVAGKRVQPVNIDLIPSWSDGRRPAEGRALAHGRRRALRRALPVGAERPHVQHRGLQGGPDLLDRRLRGADPARRPVEQGPRPGLRRPDPHRRRRAVPDGPQARARHHLALRAQRGAVQGRARPPAPAAPARRPLLARRDDPDRRLQERGRRRLRLLAVPGQPAEGRERADRLDHPRGGRHRLGRHHDAARRRRAPELRLPVDGAHALLQPAERPLGLVRLDPGGAGRLHRRPRHADRGGLRRQRLRRLRPHPLLDAPRSPTAAQGECVPYYRWVSDYIGVIGGR